MFSFCGSTSLILLLAHIPPGAVGKQRITKSLGWRDLQALVPWAGTAPATSGSFSQEFLVPEALEGPLGSLQSVGGTHRQNKPRVSLPQALPCSQERGEQEELQQELGLGWIQEPWLCAILPSCSSLEMQRKFRVLLAQVVLRVWNVTHNLWEMSFPKSAPSCFPPTFILHFAGCAG